MRIVYLLFVLQVLLVGCDSKWKGRGVASQKEKLFSNYSAQLSKNQANEVAYLAKQVQYFKRFRSLDNEPNSYLEETVYLHRPSLYEFSKWKEIQEGEYLFEDPLGLIYRPLRFQSKDALVKVIDPLPYFVKFKLSPTSRKVRRNGRKWQFRFPAIVSKQSENFNQRMLIIAPKRRKVKRIRVLGGRNTFFHNEVESITKLASRHDSLYVVVDSDFQLSSTTSEGYSGEQIIASYLLDEMIQRELSPEIIEIDASLKRIGTSLKSYLQGKYPASKHVFLKSSHSAFNTRYYFKVFDSKLWMKYNEEVTGFKGHWLDVTPKKEFIKLQIESIRVDQLIIALREFGGKIYRNQKGEALPSKWDFKVIKGSQNNQKPELMFKGNFWGISSLDPKFHSWEEDLLGEDKYSINSNKEWLFDFSTKNDEIKIHMPPYIGGLEAEYFCLPYQNRLKIQNLDVSGSTFFAVTEEGDLFTRHWNARTEGAVSSQKYTFRDGPEKEPTDFFLMKEGWYKQPPIPGKMTDQITIFSVPKSGNPARELRVEGQMNGKVGFYVKKIYDSHWRFVATGDELKGSFINNTKTGYLTYKEVMSEKPSLIQSNGPTNWQGQIGGLTISLIGWNRNCSTPVMVFKDGEDEFPVALQVGLKKGGGYNAFFTLSHKMITTNKPRIRNLIQLFERVVHSFDNGQAYQFIISKEDDMLNFKGRHKDFPIGRINQLRSLLDKNYRQIELNFYPMD